MMPDLGKYAFDVLLAYGVSFGILGLLILFVWRRSRGAKKTLEQIENG